jgi:hypothetical protein
MRCVGSRDCVQLEKIVMRCVGSRDYVNFENESWYAVWAHGIMWN